MVTMDPRLIKQYAPYVMGAGLFVVGLVQSQMTYITLAAGMIGVPGISSAVSHDSGDEGAGEEGEAG